MNANAGKGPTRKKHNKRGKWRNLNLKECDFIPVGDFVALMVLRTHNPNKLPRIFFQVVRTEIEIRHVLRSDGSRCYIPHEDIVYVGSIYEDAVPLGDFDSAAFLGAMQKLRDIEAREQAAWKQERHKSRVFHAEEVKRQTYTGPEASMK